MARRALRGAPAALALSALLTAAPAATAQTALPVLDIAPQDGGYVVTAGVLGLHEGRVTAEMTLTRSGAGGNAATRQAQEVRVSPGSRATVARTALSADAAASVHVVLTLTEDGAPIARSELRLGDPGE